MRPKNYNSSKILKNHIFFVFKTSSFAFKNVRPTHAAKLTRPLIFRSFIYFPIQPGYNEPHIAKYSVKRTILFAPVIVKYRKINETEPRYNETSF